MSYDFILMPHDWGSSWDEVLDASERRFLEHGDCRLSPACRTRLERIAGHLQAHDLRLERFATARHVELSRVEETGIQVSLFSGEMALAVAYWHTGRAARAVMQTVWAYLAILEQETGWEFYDRQLGRSLDLAGDLDEVAGWCAVSFARLHRRFSRGVTTLATRVEILQQRPGTLLPGAVAVTLRDGATQWAPGGDRGVITVACVPSFSGCLSSTL